MTIVPRGLAPGRPQRAAILSAQLQETLSVREEHAAGGSQCDIFAGAVEEAVAVVLLELPDLGADGRLRAKTFCPAREKLPAWQPRETL